MSDIIKEIFQQLGFRHQFSGTNHTKIHLFVHRQYPNLCARIIVSRYGQPTFVQLTQGTYVYHETELSVLTLETLASWIGSR